MKDTLGILSGPFSGFWSESYVALGDVESFSRQAAPSAVDSITNAVLVFIIISFFVFAHSRLLEGMFYIVESFKSYKKMLLIEGQPNPQTSRDSLLFFSVICSAFLVANYNAGYRFIDNDSAIIMNFVYILLMIGGYLFLRRAVFSALSWVNMNVVFKTIDKIYYSYIILLIFFTLFWFILCIIFPDMDLIETAPYMLCGIFLILLLYIVRGYQLIISNGFSHFFYILYLCTLEILPVIFFSHLIFK